MSSKLAKSRIAAAPQVDPQPCVALTVPAPAPTLDRAGRINYFHALSREAGRVSICAALAAGIELQRAKDECEHGMFLAWIKRNCTFAERTARRYLALVDLVLASKEMPRLLALPEQEQRETIAAAASQLDARTLTDLYADLGIVKPSLWKMGGARPGAGRPAKTETSAETLAGAEWGLLGRAIDGAMAKRFAAFLPRAMAQEALETVTGLRDALKARVAELGKEAR